MNSRLPLLLNLIFGFGLLSAVSAAPLAIAQTEIEYLLGYIEKSGCEFNRNGSWYDAKSARAHLGRKYEFLRARDQIKTAEDFIEKAATKSSISGRAYEVRCGGETAMSNPWLRDALAHYRANAGGELRGAP